MRLIHLSDLHLGKRVNEFSMLEDQQVILLQILQIIEEERPDGILIAGDIFDKSIPSEEAVRLWDDFLMQCAKRGQQVFAISGNHDSAVRFAEHHGLIGQAGIHLSPVYDGTVISHTLQDAYGEVQIYMLPFVKPVSVRAVYPEEAITDYTDACRVAIAHMGVDPAKRNVIIAHQFVTGATRSESEEIMVGGLDNVDSSVFDPFDYVALGHIHGPQKVGRDTIRYSGTPLKYSFSEKDHHKSVTVIEMEEKGMVTIRTRELTPLHDLREIRGTYEELTSRQNYENTAVEDYIHAILTDEEDVYDAIGKLRVIYPNLMKLSYDNSRTKENRVLQEISRLEQKSPLELMQEFYELQNNQPMNREQTQLVRDLIQSIWEKR